VNAIVRYGQDYTTCRKDFFEKHFFVDADNLQHGQKDSSLVSAGPCGTCDNCRRDPADVVVENIANELKTLLTILRTLKRYSKERVTMIKLISLWKGRGLKVAGLESLKHMQHVVLPADAKYSEAVRPNTGRDDAAWRKQTEHSLFIVYCCIYRIWKTSSIV
jgi:ATP-dependent DNA helicase Q1